MLRTFTSPPLRPRGGQPGNLNARTHGVYSRLSPSPHSLFLSGLHDLRQGSRAPAAPLERLLASAVEQQRQLDARLEGAHDDREYLALLEISFKTSAVISRILLQIAAETRPQADLYREALSPLRLIRSAFEKRGITRDADSFAMRTAAKLGGSQSTPQLAEGESGVGGQTLSHPSHP